jgi:hypothetical protein
MSQQSKTVTFDVTCPEPRVWLVLTSDNREPRVVEMRQRNPNNWFASEDLIPGEYRCRYYGGDDGRVVYHGAAKTEDSIDCGMDALVSVKIPDDYVSDGFRPPQHV